ncbi:MAG: IPT/TIG domain-containing protein [Sphingopyxis sp.]
MPVLIQTAREIKALRDLNARIDPFVVETRSWAKAMDITDDPKIMGKFVDDVAKIDSETSAKHIGALEIAPFENMLMQHPAARAGDDWVKNGSKATLRAFQKQKGYDPTLAEQSSAILVAGIVAIAQSKGDRLALSEALIATSFSADAASIEMRKLFKNNVDVWRDLPKLPDTKLPFSIGSKDIECVNMMRAGLGAAISAVQPALRPRVSSLDASGITSIVPPDGCTGETVTIVGTFAAGQPTDSHIAFSGQDGNLVLATIQSWSSTAITAIVPHGTGEGPIAIAILDHDYSSANVGDAFAFAGLMESCLGRPAAGAARAILQLANGALRMADPPIPSTGKNIFHGGPILVAIRTAELHGHETLVAQGQNLKPGDMLMIGQTLLQSSVNGDMIEANLAAINLPGGVFSVMIVRGIARSRPLRVRLLSLVSRLDTPRVNPGEAAHISGTCLADNYLTATLNGEAARLMVLSPNSLAVTTFHPRQNPPTPNPDGEQCEVIIFESGREIARFSIILETYRIISFGDSLMWGQGLLESQKFSELAAQGVAANATLSRNCNVYRHDRSANSGASIVQTSGSDFACGASGTIFDVAQPGVAQNLEGEKNCGATSVAGQIAQWAAIDPAVRARVNLVLIDGGINDIGVTKILDPFGLDSDLQALTIAKCSLMGSQILSPTDPATSVSALFPNARIIVIGYYPIVSAQSDLLAVLGLLLGLHLVSGMPGGLFGSAAVALGSEAIRQRLIYRSSLFANTANSTLLANVSACNDPRIRFVMPNWTPANAVFAPQAYLFGQIPAADPVASERGVLCGTACLNDGQRPSGLTCPMASIGHPNAAGARAYADAIIRAL